MVSADALFLSVFLLYCVLSVYVFKDVHRPQDQMQDVDIVSSVSVSMLFCLFFCIVSLLSRCQSLCCLPFQCEWMSV